MLVTELNTFVQKLQQLWSAGITAHLDIDTQHGLACVLSLGQLLVISITFILFPKLSKTKTVLHVAAAEQDEKLLEKLKKFQHQMKVLLLKKQKHVRMIEVCVQTILIRM